MSCVGQFIALFNFDASKKLLVGIERECHLTDISGKIRPWAPKVLEWMWASLNGRGKCYGYELSACQFEDKFQQPVPVYLVENELFRHEQEIMVAEQALNFRRVFHGVAPEDMPLEVYPDERYLRITKDMPEAMLRAACRVAGVHVHIGMPDPQTALRVYNSVINELPFLYRIGFTDTGDRLGLYREVVQGGLAKSERIQLFEKHLCTAPEPPRYDSWSDFHGRAKREGFDTDPRRLWDFIRISKHGTIEFRVFDTTADIKRIAYWAEICHDLCRQAM
jgi:hypothetical protein